MASPLSSAGGRRSAGAGVAPSSGGISAWNPSPWVGLGPAEGGGARDRATGMKVWSLPFCVWRLASSRNGLGTDAGHLCPPLVFPPPLHAERETPNSEL